MPASLCSTAEAECALGKDLKMCGDGLPQPLSQCLSLSKTEEQGEQDSGAFCTQSYLQPQACPVPHILVSTTPSSTYQVLPRNYLATTVLKETIPLTSLHKKGQQISYTGNLLQGPVSVLASRLSS